MPLTKADIREINEFVRAGQIDSARFVLSTSDDPRAKAMLDKLNAKYAPTVKAAPKPAPTTPKPSRVPTSATAPADDLAEARSLIAQRRFDEAEALLWASNSPDAGDLLKKIALVRSAQPGTKTTGTMPAAAPVSGFVVKTKDKPQTSSGTVIFMTVVATLAIIGIIVGGVLYTQHQAEVADKPNKIYLQLYSVCYYVALSEHEESDYGGEAILTAACETTAAEFMTNYPGTAEICYDQTDGVKDLMGWLACDAPNSDKLNMQYLANAINANR